MKLKFKLLFLILFVGIFIPSCFPDDKKYIEPCTNDCGYGTCIDNETNDNKLKCDCPTFLSKYEINDTQYCASIIKKIFLSDNYDIDNKGNIKDNHRILLHKGANIPDEIDIENKYLFHSDDNIEHVLEDDFHVFEDHLTIEESDDDYNVHKELFFNKRVVYTSKNNDIEPVNIILFTSSDLGRVYNHDFSIKLIEFYTKDSTVENISENSYITRSDSFFYYYIEKDLETNTYKFVDEYIEELSPSSKNNKNCSLLKDGRVKCIKKSIDGENIITEPFKSIPKNDKIISVINNCVITLSEDINTKEYNVYCIVNNKIKVKNNINILFSNEDYCASNYLEFCYVYKDGALGNYKCVKYDDMEDYQVQ